MLAGEAELGALARAAPRVPSLQAEGLALPGAELWMLLVETPAAPALRLLPPALHPTFPALLRLVVTRCPESPVGPFSLAELRLECRSGARPRAFLLGGFTDSPEAASLLAERFGFRLRPGEVSLEAGLCDAAARVRTEDGEILRAVARDLQPLGPGDVQFVASLHAAETERGLRLLQVDARPEVRRARRGLPEVGALDAAAFGAPGAAAAHPVSAVHLELDLELPPLRFVCRPDVAAFVGTEPARQDG